jgi:hypothetical protein
MRNSLTGELLAKPGWFWEALQLPQKRSNVPDTAPFSVTAIPPNYSSFA